MKFPSLFALFIFLFLGIFACNSPKQDDGGQKSLPTQEVSEVTPTTTSLTNKIPEDTKEVIPGEANPPAEAPKPADAKPGSTKPAPPASKEPSKEVPAPVEKEVPEVAPEKVSPQPPAAEPTQSGSAEPEATAPPTSSTPEPAKPAETSFSHETWDQLTRKYVSASGDVNYSGLKAEKGQIQSYLKLLSDNPPQSSWSKAKTMAYWINAYNAFTVKLILDNYPVKSILNLEGGKIWYTKKLSIGANSYTLDHIEKKLLIGKYKDARVHFAVNCAAKSCPKLMNKAFTESNLESSLQSLTRAYINNSTYNKISASKLQLSQIFEWYAADFGDVKAFVNKYTDTDVSGATISYIEYNWDLNGI